MAALDQVPGRLSMPHLLYTGPRAMTASPPPRAAHPYYMHDAIYAQPGALRLVERGNETALSAAAAALRGAGRVWLAGVGSSWHAALVGEHLLATLGGLGARARAVVASEWTAYGPAPQAGEALVALTVRLGGGSIVNRSADDVPPPGVGVCTVTGAVPLDARSLAPIDARNCVALMKVVDRGAPFHWTTDEAMKPLPLTVSVNAAPPAEA